MAVTLGDAVYLVGGMQEVNDLTKDGESMFSEIFVPAAVKFCDAEPWEGEGE